MNTVNIESQEKIDPRKQKREERNTREGEYENRLREYHLESSFNALPEFFQNKIIAVITENNQKYNTQRGENIKIAVTLCEDAFFISKNRTLPESGNTHSGTSASVVQRLAQEYVEFAGKLLAA